MLIPVDRLKYNDLIEYEGKQYLVTDTYASRYNGKVELNVINSIEEGIIELKLSFTEKVELIEK